MSLKMNLPYPVRYALNALRRAGYQAYCVGGCVRDSLLGVEPNDFDLTTSALPEETLALFKREHTLTVGLKHGTITLIKHGMPIEITTFRIDGEYEDNRRPEEVTFTSHLEEDVLRRDFTVNALCWNEQEDVVDYVGGVDDLNARIIRCVGDPDTRFQEDALRILRALRFSSKLDFDIDEATAQAVLRSRELLNNIAVERIAAELCKLLAGKRAEQVLLQFRPVMEVIVPPLSALSEEDYLCAARRVSLMPPVPEMRLAALMCDLPEQQLEETALRLKLSKKGRQFMLTLTRCAHESAPRTRSGMRRLMQEVGEETLCAVVELQNACALALSHLVIQQGDCVTLKQLAVNGQDLFLLGLPRKKTGDMLNRLLDQVIEGALPNRKEALLDYVRTQMNDWLQPARSPAKPRRSRKKASKPAAPETPLMDESTAPAAEDSAM